jgi:hypothetical protein
MKTYQQFITEGQKEYDVTYKPEGSSHQMMAVAKGENEEDAKANFLKQKPHVVVVKMKKRGLLHKIANFGAKKNDTKKDHYRTDHSYSPGREIDPDTIPVFKPSF